MISRLDSAVPPNPVGSLMPAGSASLRPSSVRMMGRDAERDVFRRPATSVNVPPRLPSLGRMNTLASWAEQLARALLQEPLPRRWRTSRASPPGHAAWHPFSALTPICWKPPPGCTTSATHPISPHGPAPTRRRPVPARRPARRYHAVPAGRPPLLRHHRSRRTRTRRRPEPSSSPRRTCWPAS